MRTVNSQIQNGKPAVIAVVTDGRPTDVEPLKNKIKQIANSLRDPGLLTIAFIEIGTPERYLKELDNDLVRQGAKADIVTVFPFTDVNEQGLAKTLARAVTMHAEAGKQSGQPPPPPRQDNRPPRPPPEDGDDRPPPPPPGPGRERPAPGNPPPRFGSGPPRNPGAPGFVEVDEKASVRRKESNRSYDNSSPGSKPR